MVSVASLWLEARPAWWGTIDPPKATRTHDGCNGTGGVDGSVGWRREERICSDAVLVTGYRAAASSSYCRHGADRLPRSLENGIREKNSRNQASQEMKPTEMED